MIKDEKLSLFRTGSFDSIGLTDIEAKPNWEMKLINHGNNSSFYRASCPDVCDGTIVAPCGCMRIIPTRSSCPDVCDGTIVAPCGCMRIIPK